MRGPVRALVWAVAVVSLALATWYGMLYVLSVPPSDGFDALDVEHPDRPRLVLSPVRELVQVSAGDVVVYRRADGNGTAMARVLFEAQANATGRYDVPALAVWNASEVEHANATWPLPATLGNGTGLYLADDRGRTPHAAGEPLVGPARIEGVVLAVHDGGRLLTLVVAFVLGSLVPIGVLLATERPRRAPATPVWDPALAPKPAATPCVDCRRPVSPGATFCLGCGAYLHREGKP